MAHDICATPCKNCSRQGLPILFTRYGVSYSAQNPVWPSLLGIRPAGHLEQEPAGVKLGAAVYNVRLLRAGYLYVHIDRGPVCTEDTWKGYVVHPHGYLTEFDVFDGDKARPAIACARDTRQANNSLVWVKEPATVKKLWYMFHPDPIEFDVLHKKIAKHPAAYMQSFDVKSWAQGHTEQANSCTPDRVPRQVLDYLALSDEKVRDATGAFLFGLMGSTTEERAWGTLEKQLYVSNFRQVITDPPPEAIFNLDNNPHGIWRPLARTKSVSLGGYQEVHGARLGQMLTFLKEKKGAMLACEDAMGITQELGFLQAEEQTTYTAWQGRHAAGYPAKVSNEWVYQTALGAEGMLKLLEKGVVQDVDSREEEIRQANLPVPFGPEPLAVRRERILAARRRNREIQMREGIAKVRQRYADAFDQSKATAIVKLQGNMYASLQQSLAKLGADQVAWLDSGALAKTAGLYSRTAAGVKQPSGGMALSLQLAQCTAGAESNEAGRQWLAQADLFDDKIVGRLLCFNSPQFREQLRKIAESNDPATLPGEQAKASIATRVAAFLKPFSKELSLANSALGFIAAVPSISESARLQKLAWTAHVASLMSIKMLAAVKAAPPTQVEGKLVRYLALFGINTLGATAVRVSEDFSAADVSRMANAERGLTRAAYRADALGRSGNLRGSALGAMFNIAFAILKGVQFNTETNTRTGSELVGSILQGVGSIASLRTSAYEQTVYKGVTGTNLFRAPAMAEMLDQLKFAQLRAYRIVAFKFLLPAALISVWWDTVDATKAWQRDQTGLSIAQYASAVGTAVGIIGVGLTTFAGAGSAWAIAGAALGLVGAVIAIIAMVAIYFLKEDDWVNWLLDSPLSRKRTEPEHANLEETLQLLANAEGQVSSG